MAAYRLLVLTVEYRFWCHIVSIFIGEHRYLLGDDREGVGNNNEISALSSLTQSTTNGDDLK